MAKRASAESKLTRYSNQRVVAAAEWAISLKFRRRRRRRAGALLSLVPQREEEEEEENVSFSFAVLGIHAGAII